jgi:hypothetical protein
MFRCFHTFMISALLVSITNCSKSKSSCRYTTPPNSLFFLLKKAGNRLPDSVLDQVKMSYYLNGNKNYVMDLVRATGEGYNLGVLTTRSIGILSADKKIKDYYIEYANGSKDTLFADYEAPTPATNCVYHIKQVSYNSQTASTDPNITVQTVYLFNTP